MKNLNLLLIILGAVGLFCSLALFMFVAGFILFAGSFNPPSGMSSAWTKLGNILIVPVGSSVTAIVIGMFNLLRR
jgi:hypothetical protein